MVGDGGGHADGRVGGALALELARPRLDRLDVGGGAVEDGGVDEAAEGDDEGGEDEAEGDEGAGGGAFGEVELGLRMVSLVIVVWEKKVGFYLGEEA